MAISKSLRKAVIRGQEKKSKQEIEKSIALVESREIDSFRKVLIKLNHFAENDISMPASMARELYNELSSSINENEKLESHWIDMSKEPQTKRVQCPNCHITINVNMIR